jgi:hypothetical protein
MLPDDLGERLEFLRYYWANYTTETPKDVATQIYRIWRKFYGKLEQRATDPLQAKIWCKLVFETPEWRNFNKVRKKIYRQTPQYKIIRKKHNAQQYEKLKTNPEYKAEKKEYNRKRYLDKKANI